MEEVNTDPLGTNSSQTKKCNLSSYKNETENPKKKNDGDASKQKKKTLTDNPCNSFDISGKQSDEVHLDDVAKDHDADDKASRSPDEPGKQPGIVPSDDVAQDDNAKEIHGLDDGKDLSHDKATVLLEKW